MAERESSSTPWVAFVAGILLVALLAIGFMYYSGRTPTAEQQPADVELNMPDVNINPPSLQEPADAPPTATPPSADTDATEPAPTP